MNITRALPVPASAPPAAPASSPKRRTPDRSGRDLSPWRSPGAERLAWALVLGVGFALRAFLAVRDQGIYWPDEIYQSLEPAHRWVFGYGFVPWEFVEGARHWAFPGTVGVWLWALSHLGLGDPQSYVVATKLLFALVGTGTAAGAGYLAARLGSGRLGALVAGMLWAGPSVAIYFAPRALSENASALLLVWGLALGLPKEAARRERLFGAAAVALAVLFRLQNAVLALGLVLVFLARRQWRAGLEVLGVLAVGAVLYGALDRVTWGGWFHSAFVYLRFNAVEGKASLWGTADAGYYVRTLWVGMPGVAVVWLVLGGAGVARARALSLLVLAFVLLHLSVPHKELRFLIPVLPLIAALAGVGFGRGLPSSLRMPALLAVAAVVGSSAARFHALTFEDVGQYLELKPKQSAYDDFGDVNRLLWAAHRAPDLCGLRIDVAHLAWTGGYTFLHREVPLYGPSARPAAGTFNYVLTFAARVPQALQVATEGRLALARMGGGPCVPDLAFSWKLP